ncbi:PREDICTED: uncharacterized protein LOC108973623 [Bactrocera latifrons]|uniref:uncharacterized protein LOC108973623 n=1 Tax=Bactrocera latifrons TaxID=174628 RepID=UPI0008DC9344|nr:PREDICTED: uncharacterized protein LOC108973623 [Bactrocera latifrons]
MDEDWMNLMNTLNCGAMMAVMEMDAELQNKKRKKAKYWVSSYLKQRNEKGRFMSDLKTFACHQKFSMNFMRWWSHIYFRNATAGRKILFQLKPNWQWYWNT